MSSKPPSIGESDRLALVINDLLDEAVKTVIKDMVAAAPPVTSTSGMKIGMRNPMRAAWDLIRGGDGGAAVRLPVGGDSEVLTVVAGEVVWSAPALGTTSLIVQEGDSTVEATATILDFDASDFNVSSSPSGEANVSLAYGTSAGTPAEGDHTHTAYDVAATVHAATSKTTPVDADELALVDSAASFALKKLTWANLKATVKTYFDTLYAAIGHSHTGVYQPLDADLTSIAALGDPNADRILFWDDSATDWAYLAPGSGLVITATTIDATASGIVVQEGDSTVAASATTMDFDASDFNVTESPSGEANIALAYGSAAGTPAEGNHTHGASSLTVQGTDHLIERTAEAVAMPGSGTMQVSGGMGTALTSGSATDVPDADGKWCSMTTSTTISNGVGYAGNSGNFNEFRADWLPDAIFVIKTETTALTGVRIMVGFSNDNLIYAADTPSSIYATFRYSTAADGTAFWRCISDTGTGTPQKTDTTVAVSLNTMYKLRIALTPGVATFYINGTLVATHSTKAPAGSSQLAVHCRVQNLVGGAGSARNIKLSRISVTHRP